MRSFSFLTRNALSLLLLIVTGALLAVGARLRLEAGLDGILERTEPTPVIELLRPTVSLGMFDPDQQFSKSTQITIDHYYLDWTEYQPTFLEGAFRDSGSHKRTPLITIEPHAYGGYPDLLENIISGEYDWKILQICSDVAAYKSPVLVRWGPKMEKTKANAEWTGQSPAQYKSAYRHFVSACRATAPNTFYVWSPEGGASSLEYWPGSSFADYTGISVFADPLREPAPSGSEASFAQLARDSYNRVGLLRRPVIITELGVVGPPQIQSAWLREALGDINDFPLVQAVIFYNTLDSPENWDPQYAVPDWRIKNETVLSVIAPDVRVKFEPKAAY